jgi:membrane protease YdiL (CAAX protease family)
MAALCTIVPLALTLVVVSATLPKPLRVAWPQLLAALLCALGYSFYVRRLERRPVIEFAAPGAVREVASGLALGAALCLATLGVLGALGVYRVEGLNAWTAMLHSAPEMVLVSVFEEILFRAVLFRIVEQAWGSRHALIASTVLFVLAHLPGDGINLLGTVVTAVAAVGLAAAYMVTRRLWLAIGLHFAWNFLFDGVFSVAVSGHVAQGWIQGSLVGPTWLSGGRYGVEASVVALLVWGLASAALLGVARHRGQFLPGHR